jgi:hypothetical protein
MGVPSFRPAELLQHEGRGGNVLESASRCGTRIGLRNAASCHATVFLLCYRPVVPFAAGVVTTLRPTLRMPQDEYKATE